VGYKAGHTVAWPRRAFWIWYWLAATLNMAVPQGRIFIGAVVLGGLWLVLVRYRTLLRRYVDKIPRPTVRFFVVGLLFSDVVMENVAINFKGDLNPNLLLNMFGWLGSCLAWVASWWILGRVYRFTPYQVFFIAGLTGILVEQNWLVPRLIAEGSWFPILAAAPLLVPVYGGAVAPAFLLCDSLQEGRNRREPGIGGVIVALAFTLLAFYGGTGLWQAAFRPFFSN
jgi:hypothetical protein